MFSFFKKQKNISPPAFLPFSVDIHSHFLPGIDDGSPDIETTLELLKGLQQLGIKKSIATPHIIGDLYRNTPQIIKDKLAIVKAACKVKNIDIELSAAAEYMLDDYFIELLFKNEPLLTLHNNIILTEFSYSSKPENLNLITNEIKARGYRTILAHPERYAYFQKHFNQYFRLREMGFILQINILSLVGYYGKSAEKAAKFIVEKKLARLVGTDLHHHRHLEALNNPENKIIFEKYLGKKYLNNLDSIAFDEIL